MTTTQTDGHADSVEQTIARLRETATVDRVFGTPIERDGTTMVPVAEIRSATARGARRRRRRAGATGRGDAIATIARPAGAYAIRKGKVRWRPAINVTRILVVGNLTAIAYFVFAWLTAWVRSSHDAAGSERPWPARRTDAWSDPLSTEYEHAQNRDTRR